MTAARKATACTVAVIALAAAVVLVLLVVTGCTKVRHDEECRSGLTAAVKPVPRPRTPVAPPLVKKPVAPGPVPTPAKSKRPHRHHHADTDLCD